MDSSGLPASQFGPVGKLQVKVKDPVPEKHHGQLPRNKVEGDFWLHMRTRMSECAPEHTQTCMHIYEWHQC